MISRLDHITIATREADPAADGYRRLLGREPYIQDGMGLRRAWFRFPNMSLEVVGLLGEGPAGDRLINRLETDGEGLWHLVYRVDDLTAAKRLLNRRGLEMETAPASRPVAMGSAAGIRTFLVEERIDPLSEPVAPENSAVAALDHVVVHTPNPDRALAIYGAKLGLDLRLDRENLKEGARRMFFRCGEAVIEIAASLNTPASDGPDRLGGLAWRVPDADAARARIADAGFDVSEVRTGRKPGTKVFTVRNAPGEVPTLMMSTEPRLETA